MHELATPYFLISETALLKNLQRVQTLRDLSGAKIVFALKCFSTWGVFELMRPYMHGTTSSSPFEVQLGFETFGGETHAYSVGFSAADVEAVDGMADKIIFNSISQLEAHVSRLKKCRSIGIRLNPEVSYSRNPLADPARQCSRLGVRKADLHSDLLASLDGLMFHFNCENRDLGAFERMLEHISIEFADALQTVQWVSLGGGVLFTADNYPLVEFAQTLKEFSERHGVQVYLEPGEAVVTKTTDLVVTVVDIVTNGERIAIVDSATEAHRLDTLTFNEPATIGEASAGGAYQYIIGASSCLAGDIFCTARFDAPLAVGDRLHILDSGGYTMVKLNWFNGLRMPSVYVQRTDGTVELINEFHYEDFKRVQSLRDLTPASLGGPK